MKHLDKIYRFIDNHFEAFNWGIAIINALIWIFMPVHYIIYHSLQTIIFVAGGSIVCWIVWWKVANYIIKNYTGRIYDKTS